MTDLKPQICFFFCVTLNNVSFRATFRWQAGVLGQVQVDLTEILFMLPQLVFLHKQSQRYILYKIITHVVTRLRQECYH